MEIDHVHISWIKGNLKKMQEKKKKVIRVEEASHIGHVMYDSSM